jgi:hypothetical protein
VSIGLDKRVNVNYALVFDYKHIRVQIEALELVKDNDHVFIQQCFVNVSDEGSLKSLLAHVQYGAVALVELDFEIQGVLCSHRYFVH